MPNYSPSPLQGSATAALTWVVYDVFLDLDREIVSVWRAPWCISKVLYLFSRYHILLALGFFLMEAIGTKHFLLPVPFHPRPGVVLGPSFYAPCIANLKYSTAARWYIGLTEVFLILAGELLILLRVNAVYGWNRKIVALTLFLFCAETVIGLVTTIISLLGGTKGLMGSTNILICGPGRVNVPDVNIAMWVTSMAVACIYLGLVIHKALDVLQDIEAVAGRPNPHGVSFLKFFRTTLPTLHMCLRDTALYFILVFVALLVNLVLVVSHERFAQLGTPWLLATYSVASTRIFLNLKDLTAATHYGDVTWSEFQRNTALELQFRAGLATNDTRPSMYEMQPVRAPEDISAGPDTTGVR